MIVVSSGKSIVFGSVSLMAFERWLTLNSSDSLTSIIVIVSCRSNFSLSDSVEMDAIDGYFLSIDLFMESQSIFVHENPQRTRRVARKNRFLRLYIMVNEYLVYNVVNRRYLLL